MKWLLFDDPTKEYNDENLYIKFKIILLGKLSAFLSLKTIENYFRLENLKFSV